MENISHITDCIEDSEASQVSSDGEITEDCRSLGPVYEFVCISFRTDNLNCFRAS